MAAIRVSGARGLRGAAARMSVATIQESFFTAAHQAKKHVTVYLVNGTRITGRVCCHDKYSVVLENQQDAQLVFKHSISAAFLCRNKECPECCEEKTVAVPN